MENETQKLKFQTQTTLSDDIIFQQILPRLPVKPLILFKSVSKSWLSSISTPQFAKSHKKFHTSQSSSPQFLLFSGNRDSHPLFSSVTFDQHGRVEETLIFNYAFNGDGDGSGSGDINVLGCCNGLVCFHDQNYNFYICNPATQQCRDINVVDCPFNSTDNIISAGFGYVSSIDDYKIVCLTKKSNGFCLLRFNDLIKTNVYMFSLRTGKWEKSLSILNVDDFTIDRSEVPALVNGVLYWCSSSADTNSHIIGVDLITSEISITPVAIEDMDNTLEAYQRLESFGLKGLLSLCYGRKVFTIITNRLQYTFYHCKVWSLNKDDLTWMKMYDLECNDMCLLCISGTGKWLVSNGKVLALLDPSRSFYRQYQGGTRFDGHAVILHKMSLVSTVLE